MSEMQILFLIVALAVVAYYADLFGWDPNERHGGPATGSVAPPVLILVVGLGLALHFDLVTVDTLLDEYGRLAATATRRWDDIGSGSGSGASEHLLCAVERIASGADDLAREVSRTLAELTGASAEPSATTPAPQA